MQAVPWSVAVSALVNAHSNVATAAHDSLAALVRRILAALQQCTCLPQAHTDYILFRCLMVCLVHTAARKPITTLKRPPA